MKFIKMIYKKQLGVVCSLLIAAAPLIVSKSACFFLWGEPECPDVLKK